MLRSRFAFMLAIALLGAHAGAFAAPAAPGDTSSTVTLFADFSADVVGAAPNLALPGAPVGDFLTLNETSGTVRVNASIDGLTMTAQMKQQSGVGGVSLSGWPAAPPPGTERVSLGWRSVAQDDNPINIVACTVRGSNGNVIASVEYGSHGSLTWDGIAGAPRAIPVAYQQNRNNAFRVDVNLLASTVSLSIDGAAIAGFQNVPFAQPATGVARLGFEAGGTAPQTFAVDDLYAVAFARTPDSAPAVIAPATASGAENAPLTVTAAASDPDGQPIASFTASPLPAGATFTANASNTSGTFAWTPDYTQAGSYAVTFTATNALSGSATTSITIADTDRVPVVSAPNSAAVEELGHIDVPVTVSDPDGNPIDALTADLSALPAGPAASFSASLDNTSGTFSWTPGLGQAGEYPVIFTATANGASVSSTTDFFVAVFGTSVTGRFTWTPQAGQEGSYTVTFTATDLGGTSSLPVSLTVVPAGAALAGPQRAAAAPGALAPQAPMKGPIISYSGSTSTSTGTTLTGTSTATTDPSLLARRLLRAPSTTTSSQAAQVGIITLSADLSGLPAGNDAQFIVDRDPIVSAPALKQGDAGLPLTVNVGADDPDADPILTLTADWSGLPSGNNAAFTTNASHTLGTLSWTPTLADSGSYTVTFQATNRLVGSASTVIHVRGAAATRVFPVGARKLNLGSGKPNYQLAIEPIDSSFDLLDVDLTSIVLISEGTGTVSQIGTAQKPSPLVGDADKNSIEDMTLYFAKPDLRQLFSLLRGSVSVPVTIQGNLLSGGRFRGTTSIDVSAGGGKLAATVMPNPLNPEAVLRFVTSRSGPVSVRLFDVSGRMVRELLPRSPLASGEHQLTIRGEDSSGRPLASGVYFYRIEAAEGTTEGRVAVVK